MKEHVLEARDFLVAHVGATATGAEALTDVTDTHGEPAGRRATPAARGRSPASASIELGQLLAGPFTGRLLGDLGAEIIKVEPPGQPDPHPRLGQGALRRPLALVAGAVAQQEVHHARTCGTSAGRSSCSSSSSTPTSSSRTSGRARSRSGTSAPSGCGGEPRARPRARLRLRPDGPVRRSGPASPPSPRRWAASATSTASPASRRRGCTSRSATRSRACSRRRGSLPRSTGATRSAAARARWSTSRCSRLLRAAREHGSGVRPARDRARPGRHGPEGRRAVEHLQVARRQVDGDRGERGQASSAGSARRWAGPSSRTTRSSPPTSPAARTRRRSRASSPSGRRGTTATEIDESSTRPA